MNRPPPPRDDQYSHRFHAGNVGDVLKHAALALTLRALRVAGTARVHYLDTHAGEGEYALGSTGEWTEGAGRLWDVALRPPVPAAVAYQQDVLTLGVRDDRPRRYPGSPRIAAAHLGPEDRLSLWERDDAARAALMAAVGADPRVGVVGGDGFAALPDALATARRADPGAEHVALVDPPFADKHEWRTAAATVTEAHRADPRARILLWYPVKSLSRPNALMAALRDAPVAATVVELVTTPLELRRNRLNGSGLVLVRPPAGLVGALAEGLATLGPLLATQAGRWSSRVLAWEGPEAAP